jgi:endonuclease-3
MTLAGKKPQVRQRTKSPAKGAEKPASTSKTPAKTLAKPLAKTAKRAPAGKTASRKRLVRPKIPRDQIAAIFARLAEQNPEPKGELEHVNAFTLLVAVVLSAQATDAGVNKATRPLFKKADTPEKMLALGEEALRDDIKTIGLYRNKAKNVIALSKALIDQYGGEVPEDRDALEQLPGVGRKTANVVMNMAFGHPTMAVDTHVFRLANRLGMAPGKTPEAVEEGLLKVVPAEYGLHAHHWLILHGRYVCKARKPMCYNCVIRDLCIFKDKTPPPGA